MTRLLIALDEQWPTRPECPWALLDADGRLLSEGHSEPRHWPAAATCEVLLLGPQCLWLEAPLPRATRRDLPRLLAYALEDRLLKDPDGQHLTVTHRRPAPDGERDLAGVLVIARERLRQLVAQLEAIGRAPRRIVAEVQTAPAGGPGWHLSIGPGGALLRSGPDNGVALDPDILLPLIAGQAASARAANTPPARIEVHGAPGFPVPELAHLEAESGVPCGASSPYLWWQGVDHRVSTLLHGEFAPRQGGSGTLTRLRPPALLGAGALALWLAASVGEVLWLKHQQGSLEERIERSWKSAFPNTPAIAPAAQMRQQLNLERARHGLLQDHDALTLLAAAAEALGTDAAGGVAAIRFEDGRLDLTLKGTAAGRADAVVGLLASRGLLAHVRREGDGAQLQLRRETLQ
ncbi:type II secretion system protein GspL [Zoogloea sp.]|uniref:type II secretion system protein GspL n=1 Tax=Zoogloea sp. TaxID=49181 RepID=UPI002601C64C|nr:type II secretion system protein GspL [Zoogloea sp.]MDD3354603.1 type II secretion system protein GspL [Zoogloea sp.]